ncbi:MAG: hypothetical protein AB1774_02385 [Bacillota bacterium]
MSVLRLALMIIPVTLFAFHRMRAKNAREALNKILAMAGLPDEVLENERSKQRARDILAGLK